MNFYRHRLDGINLDKLRVLALRHGWLVETPDVTRAGFGAIAKSQVVEGGINAHLADVNILANAVVVGDNAPSGVGPLAFTAVPFDREGPVRLWVPEHVIFMSWTVGIWLTSTNEDPGVALALVDAVDLVDLDDNYVVSEITHDPSPDSYAHLVAAAVEEIRHSDLQKVVLARESRGRTTRKIDPAVVGLRLTNREPACTLFAVPGLNDSRFVGASPEMLLSAIDGSVACHPLAGTVVLSEADDAIDYPKWLLGSSKNLFEHRVVVDEIVEQLKTRCHEVRADDRPSVVILRSVAHLGTWIYAKIDDPSLHALELLALLHPTPAVGGLPQQQALETISRLETNNRGLYAGAVGWCDGDANGEWWIGIRGISVRDDVFSAWAGAGIVADSDPLSEREETRSKMSTILIGLGDNSIAER